MNTSKIALGFQDWLEGAFHAANAPVGRAGWLGAGRCAMTDHTPGPWNAAPWEGDWNIVKPHPANPTGDTGDVIARVPHYRDQTEANARLVAAAPELLAALRSDRILIDGLLERLDDVSLDQDEVAEWLLGVQRPLMRASLTRSGVAIAKAKGGTP